jgi:methylmalonyl-CoA mutase C-terminal domain/subunit
MEKQRLIKVLIGKCGLDGHDRGAKVVTLSLRNEGMKVIYMGLRKTPEQIINRAIKENVDVIGLSSLAGDHITFFSEIMKLVKEKGIKNILIIGGGIIPEKDINVLKKMGVNAVFGPWIQINEIATYIRNNVS